MRAVVQRVTSAKVTVLEQVVGEIDAGLVVLLGVARDDTEKNADFLAEKTAGLRIFADEHGKMNRSLLDLMHPQVLVVSQFTLYGDCSKGRRPSYLEAAPPESAFQLYSHYVARLKDLQLHVQTGIFRADMQVHLVNDGPVTLLLES